MRRLVIAAALAAALAGVASVASAQIFTGYCNGPFANWDPYCW